MSLMFNVSSRWNLRVFVAHGAHPVRGFDVVLATGLANSLAATFA